MSLMFRKDKTAPTIRSILSEARGARFHSVHVIDCMFFGSRENDGGAASGRGLLNER